MRNACGNIHRLFINSHSVNHRLPSIIHDMLTNTINEDEITLDQQALDQSLDITEFYLYEKKLFRNNSIS